MRSYRPKAGWWWLGSTARRCSTRTTRCTSFSDALLFPDYFGWNWDALSDCLRDLHWLPADGYLIVVENATRVLPGDAKDRHALFSILIRAARHWSSPLGKTPVAFKVVLLCDDEAQAKLLKQEIVGMHGLPR